MALEPLEIHHSLRNTFTFPQATMDELKESLNKLKNFHEEFDHLTPTFIREKIEKIFENFKESMADIETSFSHQKTILADHSQLLSALSSPEIEVKLRDKSFNSLHGATGSIAHIKENMVNLKELLIKHQHFVPLSIANELERIFNGLTEKLKYLEDLISNQENILRNMLHKPKSSNHIDIPAAFFNPKRKSSTADIPSGSPMEEIWVKEIWIKEKPKLKVLIVDDAEINRKILGKWLDDDYECHYAIDGEDGITKYKQIRPDIILMDITMPKKDGYQATQEIRAVEIASQLPPSIIIATTAILKSEATTSIGMNDHLEKPFKQDAIKQKIMAQLNLQKHYAARLVP